MAGNGGDRQLSSPRIYGQPRLQVDDRLLVAVRQDAKFHAAPPPWCTNHIILKEILRPGKPMLKKARHLIEAVNDPPQGPA
ncbi:hypothetical protein OH779_32090 [Actinacidiphila glaucinigra]|uniref:hypothetical protein n=1 Tax=Actinacidiphila glaucinigra TaxID=235986 RepID=UPI0038690D02